MEWLSKFYPIRKISSTRWFVYTDNDRLLEMATLAELTDGVLIDIPTPQSSIGYVDASGVRLYMKSKKGYAAGILNEVIILNKISEYCADGPINIVLDSGQSTVEYNNVVRCDHVGGDVRSGSKADILLHSQTDSYPISIKKDNAMAWGSVDTTFIDTMESIIDYANSSGLISVSSVNGLSKISKPLTMKPSTDFMESVMFGKDIKRDNGCIVFRTFEDEHFTFENNTLTISVSSIYRTVRDVIGTCHEPHIMFRNDATRKYSPVPGIRAVAVTKHRLSKNCCEV